MLSLWWSPSAAVAQLPAVYQPSEMRADLVRFRNALILGHPGLRDRAAAAEFESFFTRLLDEASRPMSSVTFHLLVMRLTASLQDGHTRAFLTSATASHVGRQGLLPVHVTVQNGRIFVLRNLSDVEFGNGSEVLAIDGKLSSVILRRLRDHLGIDGGSESGLYYRLGSHYNSFYRVFPLVFGFRPTYHLVIEDSRSGQVREIALAPVGAGEFQRIDRERYGAALHLQSLDEELARPPLHLEIDREAGYALLRIRRFLKDGYDEPASTYPALLRDAFRQVAEAGSPRLIIDLRGNGGGLGANAGHLVRFLTRSAFRPTLEISFRGNDAYYSRITSDDLELDDYFGLASTGNGYTVTRAEVLDELQRFAPVPEYRYGGRLIVLIDGGTVSAAGHAAGLLQEYTDATFVGQEAGGFAGMSNGIRQLTVRGVHTDTGIDFPLAHSEFAVNPHRRARGVVPDYTVSYSADDIASGRDAALRFALDLPS